MYIPNRSTPFATTLAGWLALGLLPLTGAHAATLLTNGDGKLTGASGVTVNGALYDVAFVDDTCVALFNGCDTATDFDFDTAAEATAASGALLAQVFIGAFDPDPGQILGCPQGYFPDRDPLCIAFTPYEATGSVLVSGAYNYATTADTTLSQSIGRTYQSAGPTNGTTTVFARWTLARSTAVPEPGSVGLLALGLLGIGVLRVRRRDRLNVR